MPGHLIVTAFGAPATEALKELVDAAQSADRLAPVDVVVPSALAGVTVRRQFAGDTGIVNVRFSSLPQLAERLAARDLALAGHRLLTAEARSAAVREAIAGESSSLARAATHQRTADLLERLFTELDAAELDASALADLHRNGGERGRDLAQLYRRYRNRTAEWTGPVQVLDAAAQSVTDDTAPQTHVVLFAPRRLTRAEVRLLDRLAAAHRLDAVLCHTGESEVDGAPGGVHDVASALHPLLRDGQRRTAPPPVPVHRVVAPDAEEEVRLAVRRVVQHLAGGGQPHRVALAYRAQVPYVRLLDEQLTAAGLPHHVPATGSLAETVTGRFLLGLVALSERGYPRSEVMRWLRDAPVLGADGRPVPTARWERLSRSAGISRGATAWADRLQRYAEDPRHLERDPHGVEAATALAAFVAEVVAAGTAVLGAATWQEASQALAAALQRFLGGPKAVDRWGTGTQHAERWLDVERRAHDAALAAVADLATLDATAEAPTPPRVAAALARELDRSVPSGTTLGRGVQVTPLRDVVGTDLDLLVILGMTEGVTPPRLRDDLLLGDDARRAVSAELLTVADRRAGERRDFLAARAGAATVVLSHPRADTRAQRELHASPWFDDPAITHDGEPEQHASPVSSLRDAAVPASVHELDIALALGGQQHQLAAVDARYARGAEAVAARAGGVFGEWLGHVGPLPDAVRTKVDESLSATALQLWATCPHSFWLEKVLRVRDLTDPADDDTIRPTEKGTLVHGVLEAFFAEHLDEHREPDAAWTPAEVEHARQLLERDAAILEAKGLTGRPLLWRAQKAKLHRQLTAILAADSVMRAQRRSRPIAVEDDFGRHEQPPLVLPLPRSGDVAFAGSIDRVDRLDDGSLHVVDYKTGRDDKYATIPAEGRDGDVADLVDRGRRLQLVLYALAARERHGDDDTPVDASYWFVEKDVRRGATITPHHEKRLLDVLDVTVQNIREGVFPAHPGEEGFFGFESCGFCAFDRLCSSQRAETWTDVRGHELVQDFTRLAEEQL